MYDYFHGKLVEKTQHYAVLDIQGVGYKLLVASSLSTKLPAEGHAVLLFVSWIVREMSQTLYGFLTKEERDLFELLLTISGIGPKIALGLIGHFELPIFQEIVNAQNATALARAPGIGKKTAEKLILELKNRLKLPIYSSCSSQFLDAMNALVRLGYSQSAAEQAVTKAKRDLPLEDNLAILITAALKYPRA